MRVLNEGTRLAERYSLIRRLGSGGMSEAWLARDLRSESNVVLKFLAPGLSSNTAYRNLFHKEWQTGIRLMHAHIARVFEYHDDPDGPFYSEQFIGGPDAGILAGRPAREALRPFGLIADALRYAHGKNLVHRDIKGANILFDGRGSPYLIDFGVAAAPGEAVSGGTAVAMSPQQRAGEPPAPADDVYALGVLMHETIFGEPPTASAPIEPERLARAAASDGAPLGDELGNLLADMLATDAALRPSAEDVALRLRAAGIEPGAVELDRSETYADSAGDVAIESVQSVGKFRRSALLPADRAADTSGGRGVSPKILYGGLVALALAFVAVFYLLPGVMEPESSEGAAQAPAADDRSAGPEAPAKEAAGEDASAKDPAELAAIKAATDEALGDLLSDLERLRLRAIDRWGGQAFQHAVDAYERGDEAYLDQDYELAGERYREALGLLEPFFDRIDDEFRQTMQAAKAAFGEGNHADAVRLFDLAASITPGNAEAEQWLERARNLEAVLSLTDQGLRFENDLELAAAKSAFERALALDPSWAPAAAALERVVESIRQRSFEQRMTEGFEALAAGDLATARAAFDAAKALKPESRQPADGLLQVDQEVRLASIRRLEAEALQLERGEQWQEAVLKYEEILEIDPLLQFAQQGLGRSRERAALHQTLETWIAEPDSLSVPATMQAATDVLLRISRMSPIGPRLEDQKNELAQLLKRAATPLTVHLVSDNATEVSIFRVARLGTFSTHELQLRPGFYVAVGSRPGFRDVRLEFRVAPEIEQEPIVIMCEERI